MTLLWGPVVPPGPVKEVMEQMEEIPPSWGSLPKEAPGEQKGVIITGVEVMYTEEWATEMGDTATRYRMTEAAAW